VQEADAVAAVVDVRHDEAAEHAPMEAHAAVPYAEDFHRSFGEGARLGDEVADTAGDEAADEGIGDKVPHPEGVIALAICRAGRGDAGDEYREAPQCAGGVYLEEAEIYENRQHRFYLIHILTFTGNLCK